MIPLFRLARRPKADAALVREELALHLELRTEELVAEGWERGAAREEARRLFGNPVAVGQECLTIDQRSILSMQRTDHVDQIRQDLSFALRSFGRRPLFTVLAVAILAVGIGATTAVFSLVQGVLLRPLPYHEPDRVLALRGRHSDGFMDVSERERVRYRAETSIFSSVGTWAYGPATVVGADQPEQLRAAAIDAGVLPTLGVRPVIGRAFTIAEDSPGGANVVILGHGYWNSRWAADSGILGRSITVDDQPRVVVGVLPAGFKLPTDFIGPAADLYVPLALASTPDPRNFHFLDAVVRIAPGASRTQVEARLAIVSRELSADIKTLPPTFAAAVEPVTDQVLGAARPAVSMLLAAVVLLLALASANVAGLLLANAETRRREFAVRAAVGAGAERLVRQVVTESLALGAVGGIAGVFVATLMLNGLLALSPPGVPRADTVRIDAAAVVVALAMTILTALGAGLIPALQVRRHSATGGLAGAGRGGIATREWHRARKGLVLAEVGMAVTIAVAAGLVGRSWLALLATNPGFAVEDRLTFQLSLPEARYGGREPRWRYYRDVIDRLGELPGARAVGAITALPMEDRAGDWGFLIEGRPPVPEGERRPFADRLMATPGYFEAMGIPIKEGRSFQPDDDATHPAVVILNEFVARKYWPNGGALGARLRLSSNVDSAWRTVVAIVGDVKSRGLEEATRSEFYFPHAQTPTLATASAAATMSVVIRTGHDPAQMAAPAERIVRSVDPGVPISRLQSMERVLDTTLSVRRFQLLVLGFFALSALALVAMGVYGVVAYLVQQRAPEFGVRLALGADRRRILTMVLSDGVRMAAGGVVLGLIGAMAVGRVLAGMLYRARAFDPLVMAGVSSVVVGVVLLASLVPATRAAGTSPGATLKSD